MSEADLLAIEARLKAATPGPWTVYEYLSADTEPGDGAETHVQAYDDGEGATLAWVNRWACDDDPPTTESAANAALIAHAPTDLAALLAEVRRSRADEAAMLAAFADACLDSEPLRLAKEAGRLEALRWQFKDRRPATEYAPREFHWSRTCRTGNGALGNLSWEVWDLLKSGTQGGGTHGKNLRRYPDKASAMADLAQALEALSRSPLPETEDAP